MESRSLLEALRTRRAASGDPLEVRYDPVRQISLIREGDQWLPSWESTHADETKKADIETGEDQKGA